MNEFDKRKFNSHAPCLYEYTRKNGQQAKAAPAVDCSMNCATCGWNPAEKERRMSYGLKPRPTGGRKVVFSV